ncbi:MAG: cytochrome c biogenesis heme-transporting ATPase CcmA, partial [Caldimonas sp.]
MSAQLIAERSPSVRAAIAVRTRLHAPSRPPLKLELRDLRCVRGDRELFRGLRASATAGQMVRVRGANGAGKTSLLRMLCGLATPTDGEVRWQGEPIAKTREAFNRQHLHLGHAAALKDDLSALENLESASLLADITCSRAEALQALARAGLRGHEHLPTRLLSQGQRRRAALTRLELGAELPLWILDEPFDALDERAAGWLRELVSAHLRRGGIVVLTSHQDTALE